MRLVRILCLTTLGVCCIVLNGLPAAEPVPAREIKGTVTEVSGELVRVTRDTLYDPIPGDPAEIYFPSTGSPNGVVVAVGKVNSIGDTFLVVKIDRATGKVAKDFHVRIQATKPVARLADKSAGTPKGLSVLEPFKARQWTTFRQVVASKDADAIVAMRMSANGSKIIYATAKGTFLVNADGSNLIRLGDKSNGTNPPYVPIIDITPDGGKVVWYDDDGLHFATNDGSGRPILAQGFRPRALRMTAKGDRLFVLNTERGAIYMVPTDGTDIKKIIDVEEVTKLEGTPANNNHWRYVLDISDDGSRLVFQYLWNLYAYDATGLRKLTSFKKDVGLNAAAVSRDGRKVGFHTVYSEPVRLTVQDWDGGNMASYEGPPVASGDWLQSTRDGQMVLSWGLRVFDTDGKRWGDLGTIPGGNFVLSQASLANVSSDGKRFALRVDVRPGDTVFARSQLTVVDLNPGSIGVAPPLEDITVSKTALTTDGLSEVTISARVTSADVRFVGFLPMRDGRPLTTSVTPMIGNPTADLTDPRDGKVVMGNYRIDPSAKLAPGPITFRIAAVSKSGHALVVDVDGVEVVKP